MQTTAVKSVREENAPNTFMGVRLEKTAIIAKQAINDASYHSANDPVVVYMPVGNYNELKEFGRFKNLSVAMAIISSFNNPNDFGGIMEYHIFNLETGAKIQLH